MKKILAIMLTLVLVSMSAPTLAEEAQTTGTSAEATAVSIADAQKLDAAYTLALNAINAEDYEAAKEYLNVCFAYCDPQSNPTMYADLLLKRACIDLRKNESQWTGRNRTI